MDSAATLPNQDVILRGSVIERVGPARNVSIPPGAMLIDGRGKYLLPGLADMHVHLPGPADPPNAAEAALKLYVANGVTTVRNMAGFPNHLVLRDRVARGELLGPNIITAGPRPTASPQKLPLRENRQCSIRSGSATTSSKFCLTFRSRPTTPSR